MTIVVAIAADHGGFELKEKLKTMVSEVEWLDLGTHTSDSVDYPDFGYKLAEAVAAGEAMYGVAICGTGIGIAIACNRNPKIRAAVCTNTSMARLAREHNDANILAIGARITAPELSVEMVETFLKTPFGGGRHGPRVEKLTTKA